MLGKCTKMILENGEIVEITAEDRKSYEDDILRFAEGSLRTLILAYKEVEKDAPMDDNNFLESDLTLICLVGI